MESTFNTTESSSSSSSSSSSHSKIFNPLYKKSACNLEMFETSCCDGLADYVLGQLWQLNDNSCSISILNLSSSIFSAQAQEILGELFTRNNSIKSLELSNVKLSDTVF